MAAEQSEQQPSFNIQDIPDAIFYAEYVRREAIKQAQNNALMEEERAARIAQETRELIPLLQRNDSDLSDQEQRVKRMLRELGLLFSTNEYFSEDFLSVPINADFATLIRASTSLVRRAQARLNEPHVPLLYTYDPSRGGVKGLVLPYTSVLTDRLKTGRTGLKLTLPSVQIAPNLFLEHNPGLLISYDINKAELDLIIPGPYIPANRDLAAVEIRALASKFD
jgi:hypothetical protein